jgi:hypothetical protein
MLQCMSLFLAHRVTYRGANECRLLGEERTLACGLLGRIRLRRGLTFRNLSLCERQLSFNRRK